MNRLLKISVVAVFILSLVTVGFAQYESANGQWGGLTDVFDYPVGARAMAMGGAYVSAVDDPYALYWNPAALQRVDRIGFGFFNTNLPMNTSYNYFSFSYPTLTFGTFSAGVLRIGTGDILNTDDYGSKLGTRDFSKSLFMFGYGFKATNWFYMGTNFKVERTSLPGYDGESNYSESGLGADFGMLIDPGRTSGFLKDFSMGLSIQNFLQRTQRVVETQDKTPRNFLFGMSKGVGQDFLNHHALFAFQMDINSAQNVPVFYHMGMEYDFRKTLFLRLGFDGRGEQADGVSSWKTTWGMGVNMYGVQLDYSYWSPRYDVLSSSHRISLVYSIGKTRKQRLDEIHLNELSRFQEEVERQKKYDQRTAYLSGLEQARINFKSGDLYAALANVNRILAMDSSGKDPAFSEARQLMNEINASIELKREDERSQREAKTRAEIELQQREQLIDDHYNKATAYFETQDFREALTECDRALELDPNSEHIKGLREVIVENLKGEITKLLNEARRQRLNGKPYDAIQFYNKALELAKGDTEVTQAILNARRQLENKLNRDDTIRRANQYELEQNYASAADLYKELLKSEPNNTAIQKKYNEMYARANAKTKLLTGRAKQFFEKGLAAFTQGRYEEALQNYESARELDPLNLNVLKAIDLCRARLRAQSK